MGLRGLSLRSAAAGLALLFALAFSACGSQEEVETLHEQVAALKEQVSDLKRQRSQTLEHLDRAVASRKKAYSRLSWARMNVGLLRDRVAELKQTAVDYEEAMSSAEYDESDVYTDPYEDPSGDYYGSTDDYGSYDRDCDDYGYTDFDPGPGDPYGLDADGDGIACESP